MEETCSGIAIQYQLTLKEWKPGEEYKFIDGVLGYSRNTPLEYRLGYANDREFVGIEAATHVKAYLADGNVAESWKYGEHEYVYNNGVLYSYIRDYSLREALWQAHLTTDGPFVRYNELTEGKKPVECLMMCRDIYTADLYRGLLLFPAGSFVYEGSGTGTSKSSLACLDFNQAKLKYGSRGTKKAAAKLAGTGGDYDSLPNPRHLSGKWHDDRKIREIILANKDALFCGAAGARVNSCRIDYPKCHTPRPSL